MAIYDLKANLDLKQNMNVYATCKQLDNLNLILSIYDNSVQVDLSSYTVRLKAMKADKVPLVQHGTGISISNNVVTIECDEQLTTTSGKTLIELQFIDNSTAKKKATFNLVLIVIASTLADGATISKSTYTLLEELENKMDQASNFFENIDEAITANNNLQDSISTGNTLKTNLDNNITTGNTLNNDLETNISAGNILKPGLEGAVTSANTAKAELDISIQDANTFVSEHGDIIDLDNRVTQNTSQLNEIMYIMPDPTTRAENTTTLQALLDLASTQNIKIKFPNGIYELDTCYIGSNTELLLSENTILTNGSMLLFCNAKPTENTFTEYSGHGNIKISGGQIKNSHFFSIIHGENILIENVVIKDINWDHAIEIASCKNVKIKKCKLRGMITQSTDRQYVEYIQLDPCTYEAFPRFAEGSSTYDGTPNENITVEECEFQISDSTDYQNMYTAIGGHSPSDINHKNIKLIDNKISNASYAAIRLMTVENINVKGNMFQNCNNNIQLNISNSATNIELEDILIEKNNFINCTNAHIFIEASGSDNSRFAKGIKIRNNNLKNCINYGSIVIYGVDELILESNTASDIFKLYTIYNSKDVFIVDNNCEGILNQLGATIDCNNLKIKNNNIADSSLTAITNLIYIDGCIGFDVLENTAINISDTIAYSFIKVADVNTTINLLSSSGIIDGNNFVNCTNNTLGQLATFISATINKKYSHYRKLLYSGTMTANGTITLADDITKYNILYISTGGISTGDYVTDMIMAYYENNFRLADKFPVTTKLGVCQIDVTSSTVLTLSNFTDNIRAIYGVKLNNY